MTYQDGEKLAAELEIKFFETSVYNYIGVEEAFMSVARDAWARVNGIFSFMLLLYQNV